MARLLSLLAGWKGYAAIAAVSFCLGAAGGWRAMSWREQAHTAQAAGQTVQLVERRGKITFDVGMDFEMARLKDSNATQRRQQEVTRHVTPQIDHDYRVPCGFVRVFNAATHG